MNDEKSLQVMPEGGAVDIQRPTPTTGEMMHYMIKSGITKENVEAFTKLVELDERMQGRKNEQEFAVAFVELQKELPTIQATEPGAVTKDNKVKFYYAPLDKIDLQARRLCLKHGFTYSWGEGDTQAGKVTKIFTLQHSGGHKRSNSYTVRTGSGPYGASEGQADSAASTLAKRGAMIDGLGIVIAGMDREDARDLGAPITKEQVASLQARVKATGSNEAKFLEYAQAKTYEAIDSNMYQTLDDFLTKRERIQQKAQAGPLITAEQGKALTTRVLATGADPAEFLKTFGVMNFSQIPAAKYPQALKAVEKLEGVS